MVGAVSDPSASPSAATPQVYGRAANRITALVLLVSFVATMYLLMKNHDTFWFTSAVMTLSAFTLLALPALVFAWYGRHGALPLTRPMRAAVLFSALGVLAIAALTAFAMSWPGWVIGAGLGAFAIWVMVRAWRAPAPNPPEAGPRLAFAGSTVIGVLVLLLVAASIPKFAGTKEKPYQAAMKSDLRNLVSAEEAYYADHLHYIGAPESIPFAPTTGVSLKVTLVDTTGWFAYAYHNASPKTCVIWIGAAPSNAVRGASEGEPKCFDP